MNRIFLFIVVILLTVTMVSCISDGPHRKSKGEPNKQPIEKEVVKDSTGKSKVIMPKEETDFEKEKGIYSRKEFIDQSRDLVLLFKNWPADSEFIESKMNDDNTYVYRELIDGVVFLTLEKISALNTDNMKEISHFFSERNDTIDMPKISYNESLSRRFDRDTYKITYLTGERDKPHVWVSIYVQGGNWNYIADFSVPTDFYEDYKVQINKWIGELILEDYSDM